MYTKTTSTTNNKQAWLMLGLRRLGTTYWLRLLLTQHDCRPLVGSKYPAGHHYLCPTQRGYSGVHEPWSRCGVGTTNCNADTHKTQEVRKFSLSLRLLFMRLRNGARTSVRHTWSVIVVCPLYVVSRSKLLIRYLGHNEHFLLPACGCCALDFSAPCCATRQR